jgi:hypothetical protein
MTSPHSRNPQAAATANSAAQITRYVVIVTAIDRSKVGQNNTDPMGIATTIDSFGKYRQIGVSTVVGSGAYPQVGEQWIVDQSLGTWTFLSRQAPLLPVASDAYSLGQGLQQLGILKVNPGWVAFPPPPVTTGSTLQTTVDHLGDVWIAKHGVNGGAWKRPRDVLHCRYYKTAGWTASAGAWLTLTMDSVTYDDYGIYSASTGLFSPPITGMWQMTFQAGISPSATGQWVQPGIWRTSPSNVYIDGLYHASSTYALKGISTGTQRITSLPDTYYTRVAASTAVAGQAGSPDQTYFEAHYLGTG